LGSISIVGERRAGKSSLLKLLTVPKLIKEYDFGEEYLFCSNDLQSLDDIEPAQFWALILSDLASKVPEENLKEKFRAIVETKAFDNLSLRGLFEELKAYKIIFLFDEFETILQNPRFPPSFYGFLRYLTQNCPVAFITATRRELVYHCIDDDTKSSEFFNIFMNLVIKPFTELDCRGLVMTYLQGSGISFTEAEITRMIELSGGYAGFFQIVCTFLFYAYQNEVGKGDETERWLYVLKEFRSEVNPHFVYLWHKSEEEEKILLALMALLLNTTDTGGVSEKKLRDLYPRYGNDLLILENRSLVLRDNGNYRLFSPLFAEWIVIELTDVSQKGSRSLEEWLAEYKKGFVQKGLETLERIEDGFEKVNPRYWDLLGKTLLLVRDPKPVVELLDKLGSLF
jgi:hypothetical protein